MLTTALTGLFGLLAICGLPRLSPPAVQLEDVRPGHAGPLLPVHRGGRPEVRSGRDPRLPGRTQPAVGRGGAGMTSLGKQQNEARTLDAVRAGAVRFWLARAAGRRWPSSRTTGRYEPTDFFADGRSNRPLERGVIHRGAVPRSRSARHRPDAARSGPRSTRSPRRRRIHRSRRSIRSRRRSRSTTRPGRSRSARRATTRELPTRRRFTSTSSRSPITADDLKRGQERFTIYCAVCHGPLGQRPGEDLGTRLPDADLVPHRRRSDRHEVDMSQTDDRRSAISRGYALWGHRDSAPRRAGRLLLRGHHQGVTAGCPATPRRFRRTTGGGSSPTSGFCN